MSPSAGGSVTRTRMLQEISTADEANEERRATNFISRMLEEIDWRIAESISRRLCHSESNARRDIDCRRRETSQSVECCRRRETSQSVECSIGIESPVERYYWWFRIFSIPTEIVLHRTESFCTEQNRIAGNAITSSAPLRGTTREGSEASPSGPQSFSTDLGLPIAIAWSLGVCRRPRLLVHALQFPLFCLNSTSCSFCLFHLGLSKFLTMAHSNSFCFVERRERVTVVYYFLYISQCC
jgi:hypothetical protein